MRFVIPILDISEDNRFLKIILVHVLLSPDSTIRLQPAAAGLSFHRRSGYIESQKQITPHTDNGPDHSTSPNFPADLIEMVHSR